jgi:hypothetical protein
MARRRALGNWSPRSVHHRVPSGLVVVLLGSMLRDSTGAHLFELFNGRRLRFS